MRTTFPLFIAASIFSACGDGTATEAPAPITDPSAAATTVALYGGSLQADGQSVLRTATAEDIARFGVAEGDHLETVPFKTLAIIGGPTLVFHATYRMTDGQRQDCRACAMTLSAAVLTRGADGYWTTKAIKPVFAEVSAAYVELPVRTIAIGPDAWLLQHESCWCGAGGDCMCKVSWYALDDDPGWLEPVLTQEYHQYFEQGMTASSETLVATARIGNGRFADLEVAHRFITENMKTRKKRTREEKQLYGFDAAKGSYVHVLP